MNIVLVGCGYVADFYMRTLPNHEALRVAGVWDSKPESLRRFADYWAVRAYRSLDEVLEDPNVGLVVNLTNPDSHFEVSAAALRAGKHVYSEKPLGMTMDDARALIDLASAQGLSLGSAPCNLLGETAQTVWRALREKAVGDVRLVYAQVEDGLLLGKNFQDWRSESGSPWPWRNEFDVGCVLEHAGYYLTWLVAFFGPAVQVDAVGSVLVADKVPDESGQSDTPDFVVANISFESGVVARLTCGIVGPENRALTIFGREGELHCEDCWDYGARVLVRKAGPLGRSKKLKLVRRARLKHKSGGVHNMDFARGIADLAVAAETGRASHLPPDFCLHVNELALAMRDPAITRYPYVMTTSCRPVDPMPWAIR